MMNTMTNYKHGQQLRSGNDSARLCLPFTGCAFHVYPAIAEVNILIPALGMSLRVISDILPAR